MSDEIRPHPDHPDISCGADGTVYRRGVPVVVKPNEYGYLKIPIHRSGERVVKGAHVLVCETFHGPRPPGMQAAHWNGDPADNRAENLRWATPGENAYDKLRHGTHKYGSLHVRAKLTEEVVAYIREYVTLHGRGSQNEMARRFGVSPMTVSNIVTGRNWRHVEVGLDKTTSM